MPAYALDRTIELCILRNALPIADHLDIYGS